MSVDGFKLATDADFDSFRAEADSQEGWVEVYNKENFTVWSKKTDSAINIVKVLATFDGIPAETLYDVLHDHHYRGTWDESMIEGSVVQMLNSNNEIGYYSAKVPTPVTNRDFVTHRKWRGRPEAGEWIIFNNSVEHKGAPHKKGFVRANSILTGYVIKRVGSGCSMLYLTQSDPCGWIPGWLVNSLTSSLAPKLLGRLADAAKKYPEWKTKNNPDHKPWLEANSKH